MEFDVLSALEEVEGPEPDERDELRDLGRELGLDAPASAAPKPTHAARGQRSHQEFVLPGADAPASLALELDRAAAPGPKGALATSRPNPAGKTAYPSKQTPTTRSLPLPTQPPLSAAALRTQVVARPEPTRNIPLSQVLCGVSVFALAYWLDRSVLYGNAGTFSIVAHGLALQQIWLGVRGLRS